MFSILDDGPRLCDRLQRRELLRAGSLAALSGLLPQAAMATSSPRPDGPAKRCIVLFLMGGAPQHSTWDPKPLAPREVRGEFAPIPTVAPGLNLCELMP